MNKVISILNLKGGAGKTTVATNLAVAFANANLEVLLIDSDKQSSSIAWRGERPDNLCEVTVLAVSEAKALKKQISILRKKYKMIIIDGAPHADLMASETISLSDFIILPVNPSPLDLWATEVMVERIKNAQAINPEIHAAFLLNRFSERVKLSRETAEALKEMEFPVLKATLGNRVAFADAILQGLSVLEYEGEQGKANIEVENVYQEIIKWQESK